MMPVWFYGYPRVFFKAGSHSDLAGSENNNFLSLRMGLNWVTIGIG